LAQERRALVRAREQPHAAPLELHIQQVHVSQFVQQTLVSSAASASASARGLSFRGARSRRSFAAATRGTPQQVRDLH
jgi:hypothetical protein